MLLLKRHLSSLIIHAFFRSSPRCQCFVDLLHGRLYKPNCKSWRCRQGMRMPSINSNVILWPKYRTYGRYRLDTLPSCVVIQLSVPGVLVEVNQDPTSGMKCSWTSVLTVLLVGSSSRQVAGGSVQQRQAHFRFRMRPARVPKLSWVVAPSSISVRCLDSGLIFLLHRPYTVPAMSLSLTDSPVPLLQSCMIATSLPPFGLVHRSS